MVDFMIRISNPANAVDKQTIVDFMNLLDFSIFFCLPLSAWWALNTDG